MTATTGPSAEEIVARLAAIVGAKYVITDVQAAEPYLKEPRGLFVGATPAVVEPKTTAEVSEIGRAHV